MRIILGDGNSLCYIHTLSPTYRSRKEDGSTGQNVEVVGIVGVGAEEENLKRLIICKHAQCMDLV